MKRILAMLVASTLVLSAPVFAAEESKKAEENKKPESELKTFPAKVSYTLGVQLGGNLLGMYKEVDLDAFFRGLKDGYAGNTPLLTEKERAEVIHEFGRKQQEERIALAGKNQKEGEEFLEANGKKKGVVTTKSGLQYIVQDKGKGAKPKPTDWVQVYYRGTLLDGTEFDKKLRPDEPATFPIRGVIPGWTEALQLMRVGSKCRLFIPANLAYKDRGSPPKIGPNATLTFDVELVAITKPPAGMGGAKGLPPGHP